ncbi:MAG TPA: GNAT family N-acetyltransferase [Nocardioides sp.]|nr:GNAT family N-acetyltransferase [Nocardioides sp.]
MPLPDLIATERLTLPLWTSADVASIRGRGLRQRGWHADFPRRDDIDAASMWRDGDVWGPRSITRGVTVLGSVGFFGPPEDVDGVQETEIGYGLVREACGWGFATEAVRAMVAAAEAEGVRIRASVEPTNAASVKVLAKAGFTQLREATPDGLLVMVRPFGGVGRPSGQTAPE